MMSDEDIKRTSIGSVSIRSTASENNNNETMSTVSQNIQSSTNSITDNNTNTTTTPTRTANRRASVETIEDQTGPTPPPPMIQDAIQKAEESNEELRVNELQRPRPFRYSDIANDNDEEDDMDTIAKKIAMFEKQSSTREVKEDLRISRQQSKPVHITNVLTDYDDDDTIAKKLAKYGYDNDADGDRKPAASRGGTVVSIPPAPPAARLSAASTGTEKLEEGKEDEDTNIDMADAIREFALLTAESRSLRNEIVRLQTSVPRDLEVVTRDLESQLASVISSQLTQSQQQISVASGDILNEQEVIPEASPVIHEAVTDAWVYDSSRDTAITPDEPAVITDAELVDSLDHPPVYRQPVYSARRVSFEGEETMPHHCRRVIKQNRKKLTIVGLIFLLAVVLIALGVGGVFTSEPQPMILVAESTAMPSVSHVPTLSPAPTSTQAPSTSPSISLSPTETCFWIDITIEYDDDPHETSFELWRRESGSGSNTMEEVLIYKNEGNHGDSVYKKSKCLTEGEYEFTIKDTAGDGICCGVMQGNGHYNVTSNGILIAEGGEFNRKETSLFMIPFVDVNEVLSPMTSFTEEEDTNTTNACESITSRKNCIKSNDNCLWDTTAETGPVCVLSESQ